MRRLRTLLGRSLEGKGHCKFNGETGDSITFKFVDGGLVKGEPGKDDQISLLITKDSDGSVVLNVPVTTVSGGNLQAHFDQPHKDK